MTIRFKLDLLLISTKETSDDDMDWGLIIGIAGGTLLIVIALIFFIRGRTSNKVITRVKRNDYGNSYDAPYTLYTS